MAQHLPPALPGREVQRGTRGAEHVGAGGAACYTNLQGDQVLLYEYDDRPVQVLAIRYGDDWDALYAWWSEWGTVPLRG